MKKVASLIAVGSILVNASLINTVPVYAEETKSSLNNKLSKNKEEQVELDDKIKNLDSQIKEIEENIKSTEDKIEGLNVETEEAKKEIQDLENKIKDNEDALGERLKVINNNYSMAYIKVILSSNSLSDFFNNIYMVKEVIQQDRDLLKELDENKSLVEEKKKSLEDKVKEQELLKSSLESDNNKLESDKAEVEELKNQLAKEEEELESQISKIIAEEEAAAKAQAEAEAQKQQATSSSTSSGASSNAVVTSGSWPVPGYSRISSPYGYRIHPVTGASSIHTGIDIPAPTGTPVTAYDSGTVIYSGVQGTYGNTVMIRHNDGKVTLYAHNSALNVSVGQTVQKGQVVAKIGSTGRSTGPHLHFEIRVNGSHTNPMNYL